MVKKFFSKLQSEDGQGLVEYALIIVLVSVALVVALQALTSGIDAGFTSATGALNAGVSAS